MRATGDVADILIQDMGHQVDILDRMLDPVGRALGPDAARRLLALRADDELQRRIDDLADRSREGLLTPDERAEYDAVVGAIALLSVLQAKARSVLAASPAA
jgi:nucleoside-diphosphate-sugar epimerase